MAKVMFVFLKRFCCLGPLFAPFAVPLSDLAAGDSLIVFILFRTFLFAPPALLTL